MIIGKRLSPFCKPDAIPRSIQARLRLSPSRCASLGSPGSGETTGSSQLPFSREKFAAEKFAAKPQNRGWAERAASRLLRRGKVKGNLRRKVHTPADNSCPRDRTA